jgi:hypothetical protein
MEIATEKFKRYKFLDTVQILAKLIKAGGETLHSIWNKEDLPQWWKESITVPIYKRSNRTENNNY